MFGVSIADFPAFASKSELNQRTTSGNLFVVVGEPDIEVAPTDAGSIQVTIKGVGNFHPQTGEISITSS